MKIPWENVQQSLDVGEAKPGGDQNASMKVVIANIVEPYLSFSSLLHSSPVRGSFAQRPRMEGKTRQETKCRREAVEKQESIRL